MTSLIPSLNYVNYNLFNQSLIANTFELFPLLCYDNQYALVLVYFGFTVGDNRRRKRPPSNEDQTQEAALSLSLSKDGAD